MAQQHQGPEDHARYALPASFGQERLWFFSQLTPDLPIFNMPIPVWTREPLTVAQYRGVVADLVARHETLRTALASKDGELIQVVHDAVPVDVPLVDLRAATEAERDRRIAELTAADSRAEFALDQAPLWRARLYQCADGEWLLHFVFHHVVFDGQSVRVLLDEVAQRCRAVREDRAPVLPDMPIQYGDFAAWQRRQLAEDAYASQLKYWELRFDDLPVLDLPTDFRRPAKKSYRGGELLFEVPTATTDGIGALARQCDATPFVVALAGYATVLHRLSGQPVVMVGSPIAGRELPELAPIIGMLVNTVVFRVDCAGDPTFRDFVMRVRPQVAEALDNADVPFDKLVDLHQGTRDPSRSPLYQAGFNLLPVAGAQTTNGTAKFDILLDLSLLPEGRMVGRIEYSTDLFTHDTAGTFADRFQRLLAAAVADPDTPIGALPLTSPAEREQLIRAGRPAGQHDGATAPPAGTITDRFAAVVAAHPDRDAVVGADGTRLTYAALDRRANRLAHRLIERGVGTDATAVLFCPNNVDLVVAAFAVLKAGGAYVPLDPDYPPRRVAYFLDDTAARVVIATSDVAGRLPDTGVHTVLADQLPSDLPATAPTARVLPSAAAYALYTSGSTGRPKAVVVEHRNVLAYLDGLATVVDQRPGDGYAMLQPLTFDFSVSMFYGALLTGGTVHLAPRDLAADAAWVSGLIRDADIDHLKITPSHLAALRGAVTEPAMLLPRRALLLGGEASRWSMVDDLRRLAGERTIANHYGPTEATVGCLAVTADRLQYEHPPQTTPIGFPLTHVAAYILDDRGEPVPDGVTGELYIGGAQVTRGYLNRPALAAERFVPDPFSGSPGARLYRTGDRVRRLRGGEVEFLGRVDDQVKVRGYRIELGEVTRALISHPGIADGIVLVRGPVDGLADGLADGAEPQLVGYALADPRAPLDIAGVRDYLAERLPGFMVPTRVVPIDTLPLTAHGKVDRSRLPDPTDKEATAADIDATAAEPPRGATEETVAAMFGRLLERDAVGRHDSFFALGGHSLLATQLANRLRATFGVPLSVRAVFETTSVAHLAEEVEAARRKGGRRLPPVTPVPRDPAPLASYGQTRLWFLDQLERMPQLYNTNLRLRISGPLDTARLRGALLDIVARHEVLRTRLVRSVGDRSGAEVVQVIHPEPELPFTELDASDGAEQALRAHANTGIDLTAEPPLRVLLVHHSPRSHTLLITIHHAATDAWSAGVLIQELRACYDGVPLPPLPVQYADVAAWQRDQVTGRLRETQLAYWRRHLAGMPPRLDLPTDRPRPARRGFDGSFVPIELPAGVADRLRALGAAHDATLFMVLLAAFQVLLARYTGREDIVVGTPAANRLRPEMEPLIGFFLNTLVVRTDCSGDPSFTDLLARVRQTTLDAYANAEVPFEALVDELAPPRDPGSTPLVQVLFTVEDAERTTGDRAAADRTNDPVAAGDDLDIAWQPMGTSLSRFDVSVYLWRGGADLTGAIEYRTDLFDAATMRHFADHFRTLVEAVGAEPDRPLSALSLLTDADVALVESWQGGAPVSWGGLTGPGVAVGVWGLVGRLCEVGVGAEVRVGVCLSRDSGLVDAVHAVVAAGGAYVPLEPEIPDARLLWMVADAGVSVVVTDAGNAHRFASAGVVVVVPDWSAGGEAVVVEVDPDALAYVIYTSGSSGRPKGVGVSRRAVAARLGWMQRVCGLDPHDVVLVKTPFSFDVSVWELFWPLAVGASQVVAPAGLHRDPTELARLMGERRVTTVHFVPSMLAAFLDVPGVASLVGPSLRRVVCSGEALSPGLVRRFHEVLPGVDLFNLYGPTEAAVDVSWRQCRPGDSVVPIGVAAPGVRLEVLDSRLGRVPVGVPGELCIGGVQVARGYVGWASLTADRFVPSPFDAGERLYRTGDLARWLPSGELEYLGRLDDQVKIRGQRIEPGEIEAALAEQPEVHDVRVIAHDDGGGARLVAYWVPEPDADSPDTEHPGTVDWHARLRDILPAHLIPSLSVRLPALPLTPNGKLDRAALPAPEPHRPAKAATSPETPAERAVAAAYRDVLGVESVGTDDDFFGLGGDSLRSVAMVARLRELGYHVALADVFLHQSVGDLAAVAKDIPEDIAKDIATPVSGSTDTPDPSPRTAAFDLVQAADLDRLRRRLGNHSGG